ncbi:DUF6509 family protein [Bacillus suaedae]|uniref:Pullulanase n=1 Tax=Halalkalibacter suaedae TaxID=2822140 RepID=A0A941AQ65_9BACI|nr:DUF6509 family protein [Bacillus suaedae]MBP3950833.1 pullulanase [Bacillus suaedae]
MNIIEHTVEKVQDPVGIIVGDRYEFFLSIEVDEEDDLYSEKGIYIRVILAVNNQDLHIKQYQIVEYDTEEQLDFELEDDELQLIKEYCQDHLV